MALRLLILILYYQDILFNAGTTYHNAPFQTFPARFCSMQVVRSLLVSLAHHENYHALFNHFVRQNPLILEEKEGGFLGLLDYNNKLSWIRKKLTILT